MANNNNLLWHFSRTVGPDIPVPFTDPNLFKGQYVSPAGHRTAVVQTNITSGRSGTCTNGFVKALLRAKQIANGCDKDGYGYNDKMSIAEYTDSGVFNGPTIGSGEVVSVAYNLTNGLFTANRAGQAVNTAKESSAPFFLALWPQFLKDSGFKQEFDKFCNIVADVDEYLSTACLLADMAYSMTAQTRNVQGHLPICEPSQVKRLAETSMNTPKYKPTMYWGNFEKFPVAKQAKKKQTASLADGRAMKTSDFIGSFQFSSEPLTEEQEKLVPKLDEKYIVGETLLMLCKHIKETTNRSRPIRNILLRGEPGTGKTEMYVGIAAGCNLPLYTFAANAMTEPFDLFGQFVPVDDNGNQTGKKVPIEQILSGMPSSEDISMDPVYAYQTITGMYKADATAMDCMSAMFNLAQKSIDVNGGQQRFKFVPGQLIYAMKNGGVWGFDEVTLPQNPGVVPALNPAMDGTNSITLPTGEIIKRHPNCIFVGTTNIDLEGCRRLNQAWQDRCQLIIDVEEPSDEELIARVKSMTDYDDTNDAHIDLYKFVRAYHEIKELVKRHRYDDGQVGPRKLADWVSSTMITGDAMTSARYTIIPGATADSNGMAELMEKLSDIF